MKVELISITNSLIGVAGTYLTPEEIIVYTARVSSPANQDNLETAPKLIKYLIKQKHWSPFEMVDLTFEVETSRAIAAQILRHKSFSFQEFSQRYSEVTRFETYLPRRQDVKNRQNSIDDLPKETADWFLAQQEKIQKDSMEVYNKALELGIAKECARFLLPLETATRLYIKGSVRSWIHYFDVRCDGSTQKEHRDIALQIREIFFGHFPNIKAALLEV
jgi:thymidylate synthase (FAD)